MLPMKYVPGLGTEFQFDWIPNYVYLGYRSIFPKWTSGNVYGANALGAFSNRFYGANHTTYDDLPDLWSSQEETERQFYAARYINPKTGSQAILDCVQRTYSPLRDYYVHVHNMQRIRMEDLNYQAPDYEHPSWQPRPYRYQDCYWLCSSVQGRTLTIRQVIAWAVLLFYNLADTSVQTLGSIEQIGFTFLSNGSLSGSGYLSYIDPVPQNTGTTPLYHYGFGGFKPGSLTRPMSNAVVLKDYTKSSVRHTVVALKGLYNWIDDPFYTQGISQPYLNFGQDSTPKNGKVLILGAEYYGEQN